MSARLLFEIALRVFGLWFVFLSINSLLSMAGYHLSSVVAGQSLGFSYFVAANLATFIVQILLGGMLVYWAPNVAVRFYPQDSESGELRLSVGPGDVYRTACFVLGAYLLVQTATPAAQLVVFGFQGNVERRLLAVYAITMTVSLASGLILVFGSRNIAEFLSNLRYDSDTIPAQRISIGTLLILLTLFAIVLGVVRAM